MFLGNEGRKAAVFLDIHHGLMRGIWDCIPHGGISGSVCTPSKSFDTFHPRGTSGTSNRPHCIVTRFLLGSGNRERLIPLICPRR